MERCGFQPTALTSYLFWIPSFLLAFSRPSFEPNSFPDDPKPTTANHFCLHNQRIRESGNGRFKHLALLFARARWLLRNACRYSHNQHNARARAIYVESGHLYFGQ